MRLFIILFGLLAITSCSSELPKDESGREDFEAFYNKFYTDSLFQLSRIEFPMLGTDPNGSNMQFIWTTDNWKIIKKIDLNSEEIDRIAQDMGEVIQEKIIVQKRFMIQIMYSLVNNKWYLTSYSGIRDIAFFSKNRISPKATPIDTTSSEETTKTDTLTQQ